MDTYPDSLFLPMVHPEYDPRKPVIPWMRWGEGGGLVLNRAGLLSRNHLFLCDNLDLLPLMPDACVDLVYIDPPFGTGLRRESPKVGNNLEGYDDSISDPRAFVEWLAPRLAGLGRILSASGNLVIHLDHRAVHYVRIWCDTAFGADRWENEIIWHYTGGGRSKTRFSRKHDVLLWYSKGNGRIFNIDQIREPYKPTSGFAKDGIVSRKGKKYLPHPDGTPADDVWDIPIINPLATERTPYPTQKPIKLLERVIAALSCPADVVCDIFCGSGTTAVASNNLGRSYLCCDINPDAVGVTLDRLAESGCEKPPSLISHGMYRGPIVPSEDLESAAERYLKNTLRVDGSVEFSIKTPFWNSEQCPPSPLRQSDMIISIESGKVSDNMATDRMD
jgi:site-specific DNA-methyltransferase (adenine-specific)